MGTAYAMTEHTPPDIVGPALGALATAVAGVLGWLGMKAQAKSAKAKEADPQAVQNDGWEGLLNQMRTELKAAARQRDHLNSVLEEERRNWRTEQAAWSKEREAFLGEIRQLQAVAEGFERLLRRNGITLPERKTPASEAEVVGATLRQGPVGDDQ